MTEVVFTYSSELMSNYKQAEIMAPDSAFQALQTGTGAALLFSIGTDGICYVTQEVAGGKTGWDKTDLSSALCAGTAKTFAVAQNRSTGAIDMALALTDGTGDSLYLSLGNSASDPSWVKQPKWLAVPYDDAAHPLSAVSIADLFISEASDGEYIAVDVIRDPSSAEPVIFRYFIDPTKKLTKQAWNAHDVAGDIDAATVSSCLGRRHGDRVDGLYTLGSIAGEPELIFQPLYNAFKPAIPADPVRLLLPGGAVGTALAAASTGRDETDLFVTADQKLYYFPAAAQQDQATGTLVLDDPLLADVATLFGYGTDDEIILWGRNRANQIFYTRCARSGILDPTAWSALMPICSAEQISPYVNRADDANTFFVHTGPGRLQRAVQAGDTLMWKFENILLPVPPTTPANKNSAYTTRIQVNGAQKQPLANTQVEISALHRVGVYINGLYYILDTTPLPVSTDAIGSLNIIEWVNTLTATPLKVTGSDGTTVAINPMAKPFQKAAALGSAGALASATIANKDGGTRPLVPAGTSQGDLQTAASALGQLGKVYQSLPADGSIAPASLTSRTGRSLQVGWIRSLAVGEGRAVHPQLIVGGILDPIEAAAGDLLNWIEGAADYVVHLVQDAATDLWHFVVEIADKAYYFVLDAAEKVVGALVAIYDAIKTAIEDLIAFLEFLFEWKDFVRTKDVCKKLLILGLNAVAESGDTLKQDIDNLLTDARTKVDDWADVKQDSWAPKASNSDQPVGYLRSVADIENALTAPALFLYHHFSDNVSGAQATGTASGSPADSLLDQALAAMEDGGDLLLSAANRIQSDLIAGSQFETLSLEEVLKRLTAIVVDAFLDGTEVLLDTLVDLVTALLSGALELLDSPIWIPVVSDILEDVFGVEISFSMLDVIMMVAAIPATLVYKGILGSAPFSEGDGYSDKILGAADLPALRAALAGPDRRAAADEGGSGGLLSQLGIPIGGEASRTIYIVGHTIAGVASLIGGVVTFPAVVSDEPDGPAYQRAVTACGAVTGFSIFLSGLFNPNHPIANKPMADMATILSVLGLAGKVATGLAPYVLPNGVARYQVIEKVGAGFDGVLAVLALIPSCYHMYELSGVPAGTDRSEAYLDETASICADFSRIARTAVVFTGDPESKAVLAGLMLVLMILYGGLEIAETVVEASRHD